MRPLWLRRFALAACALLPLNALADPIGYAVGFSDLYRVDLATGAATLIGPIGFNDVEGLAIAPDGTLYGVADATQGGGSATTDFLLRIDTTTGQGTLVGQLAGLGGQGPAGNLDYGLAFTCDARLWLASDTTQSLWEVDLGNAGTRLVGGLGASISGLAGRGSAIYGVSVGAAPMLFRIDTQTAVATSLGTLNAGGVVDDAGLDFDANGTLWATLDSEPAAIGVSRFARIDVSTGQATVTANATVNLGMEGLAIARVPDCDVPGPETDPVPVPGPAWPMLVALVLLLGVPGGRVLRLR